MDRELARALTQAAAFVLTILAVLAFACYLHGGPFYPSRLLCHDWEVHKLRWHWVKIGPGPCDEIYPAPLEGLIDRQFP